MKPPTTPLWIFTLFVFALSAYSQASQDIRYNFEYSCNKERIVVGHCRHDSDMAGYPRTKPEDDYCQVYYPDRPKMGGFEAFGIALRADLIVTLQACGALRPVPVPPSQSEVEDSVAEFKVGDAYFKGNDYARALEHFKKSNAIAVSSAAYIMTGITQYKLKMYADAIVSLKETTRLVPDNPEAHYWLGMAYRDYGANSKDQKPYASAETELREAVRLKPEYQSAYTGLGSVLYIERKYPDALTSFQQALRLNPNDGSAKYLMGYTYVRMGQKEKAMEVYRNLVAADPKSAADLFAEINKPATTNTTASAAGTAEYFVNEGGKFRDAENYTNAIESYKKAIALKPGLSLAHLNLGFCYFQLKQYEAALSPFQQAARLDPADADNYFWLGVTYYKLKQYPSAMTTLKEAIRLNPKSPFNHYDLGETYLNGFAQYDKAVPEYQEAIRLKPDYDLAHNQLGLAYLWQNQYPDALIEFQTAFRLKGNAPESSPTYLENIGIAYVRLGKKDEAMKVYQMLQKSDVTKAKELLALINNPPLYPTGPAPKPATSVKVVKSSSSTASLIEQAVTYFDARDFAKAIEACKKAMVAEPKNQKANFYLAMSYDQSEQWENAVKAWNNYIPLVNSGPNEFILLGDAHRYLKHYNEALNAYQKALDLKPDAKKASGVYYWIGTIYNDTKQYDKAIDSLLTSISLDPNYRHSRLALGRAYLLTGRPPEGIASLKEAIRIKPDFAEAHYYLGLCYLIVEKKEKAMEEYKVLQTVDKSWASELLKHINSPLE